MISHRVMKADQSYFRTVLLSELTQRRTRNPAYSTRAFASALRLNSGALSGILNGKRRVSPRMALTIADRLALDPERRLILERSVAPQSMEQQELLPFEPLDMDQFRLMSEWQNFAVLSLAKKQGIAADPQLIADRLGIAVSAAEKAVELLRRLGLIELKDGRLRRSSKRLATTDGIADTAIQKAHREDCELAARSLEQDPIEARDFSSITFRLDPASLKEIAGIVRRAQDRVLELSDAGEGQEVYRMSVHVFPLTRLSQEEQKS